MLEELQQAKTAAMQEVRQLFCDTVHIGLHVATYDRSEYF
jgi:hypothetical protein